MKKERQTGGETQDIVTPFDILQMPVVNGRRIWVHKGSQLDKGLIENLKAEADIIAQTSLWKMLIAEGKYHAQERAMMKTKTGDDEKDMNTLREAQAVHDLVLLLEQFIKNIKNY